MTKSDFYYNLPEELIAQTPVEPRDSARLLVYDRHKSEIKDKYFYEITEFLRPGDCLVINNTRVLPARIIGTKRETGAIIEFLLHKRIDLKNWEVLCKPAKRVKVGTIIDFADNLSAEITALGSEGIAYVKFDFDGVFEDILREIGEMPLPHYIHKKLEDGEKYQTVYSKTEGSSAAPTAGLHFTTELLQKIKDMGVEIVEVLLHVGLGTFRPVKSENIADHVMHSEYFEIGEEAAKRVNLAKSEGRRVIAVGTTSVRILESGADKKGHINAVKGYTDIFIYPPYEFKIVDALITNFHLPESTLIMLVSAFCGREETLKLYEYAVRNKYRFFSFGDAMLVL